MIAPDNSSIARQWRSRDSSVSRFRNVFRIAFSMCIAGLAICGMLVGSSCCYGQDDPKSQVRDALESLGNVPWYDSETDSAKPAELRNSDVNNDDLALRKSGRVGAPRAAAAGGGGRTIGPIGDFMGWFMIIVTGILLAAIVIYALYTRDPTTGRRRGQDVEVEEDELFEQRLEQLPVQVRKPLKNLLDEAKQLMAQGKFDEAIIYLFSHQLVELDRNQMVRLAQGKTNRQYLRELSRSPQLREILHQTVLLFEESFFGNHTLTQEQFASSWRRVDEFTSILSASSAGGSAA